MRREPKGILSLNWMGKDDALIPVENGRYKYAWVDTADPRAREVKTIEIVETVGDTEGPTSAAENLLIVGDSGDALRSLGSIPEYSERYLGKVKLVYIDPPFNTGQVFKHYADQLKHSIWLTMIRDRIRDITPLLAQDGSIWVHLDDVEVHRMRCLLDEEFGPENFVAEIVWQKVHSRDNRTHISPSHDILLVYAAGAGATQWKHVRNLLPHTGAGYANPDNDPRGLWTSDNFTAKAGPGRRAEQFYTLVTPAGKKCYPTAGRCWLYTQDRYEELLADNRVYFGKDGTAGPRLKRFLNEVQDGLVPTTWWPYAEVGTNDAAKKEITDMFPGVEPFDTPKPERLLQRIIHIATNPGDIVLDCFAGSGTTPAVAHKMGRRWLASELLPETVETFTRPRLAKVVNGDDPGGVTTTTVRVAAEDVDLPDKVSAKNAQDFTTWLGKFAEDNVVSVNLAKETVARVRALAKSEAPPLNEIESETLLGLLKKLDAAAADGATVDVLPLAVRTLRAAAKTKDETSINWTGGGGFTVAHMGPSMYEVDDSDGTVYLSAAATNGAWSKAVAGQLNFTLTPDDPVFCGVRKRQRLAVIDGIVDEIVVRTVVESLADGELAVIVGKAVLPEAAALLKGLSRGSRIRKAPDQMFQKMTVK